MNFIPNITGGVFITVVGVTVKFQLIRIRGLPYLLILKYRLIDGGEV
jgi:hypothetical protein